MDKYYTACTAMVVFSMVIMLISVRFNIGLVKKRRQASATLFAFIIIGAFCEWSGVMLDGKSASLIPLHILVKTIELSLSPFIGLLCGRSFNDSKSEKVFFYILLANVVLEVISAFSGLVFYVDASNVYHHGTLYFVYLTAYVLGIVYFVERGISISRQFSGKYGMCILLVVVFAAVSIATQLMDSSIRIDWIAISVSAIMLYKFYGDMLLQIDGLTGLLNHWSYEHALQKMPEKAVIVFLDVDRFKAVNDTYGHQVGDECLERIAACIRKAYGNYGMCFRYGGDEFCVIMNRAFDNVEKITGEFYKALEQQRKLKEWMPDVSYGCARYDSKVDDIQAVMSRADESMYRYKESRR